MFPRALPLLLLACSCFAASETAAIPLGSTRAEVVSAYGEPSGAVTVSDREILTYPNRRVTLTGGRVTADTENTLKDSFVTTVAAKPVEWLGDLGAATAQAEQEKKQILVLFVGPTAPDWAPVFEKAVVNNHAFLRRFQPTHVFLKLKVGETLSSKAGINEVNDHKRLEELRSRAVGDAPLPALAILSADTRKTKTISLAGIEKATDRMDFFTSRAIEKAKTGPITVAQIPVKVVIIGVGLVAAMVMLFRRGKPADSKNHRIPRAGS